MTDPRYSLRINSDHRLREHLRSASMRATSPREADDGKTASDLLDARVALGVRRARAWLEAKIAGAAPDESLLARSMEHAQRADARDRPGDARAREIAWKLRRALKE